MVNIAIINASTVLSDAEVQAAIPALQTQISRDFVPLWNLPAKLHFYSAKAVIPSGYWWIAILDTSDEAGALGYHDLSNEGLPLGKVFAGTDLEYGSSWTVTASHELLEALADPYVDWVVQVDGSSRKHQLWALEVGDPVEADDDGYKIKGVQVSNFVTPAYFEVLQTGRKVKFDFRGLLKNPFTLRPGGYASVYDFTGGGWTQISAEGQKKGSASALYRSRPPLGSRRERRRTPKEQWQKSTAHG